MGRSVEHKLAASSTEALSKIGKLLTKFMQPTNFFSDLRRCFIEFGQLDGTNCKGTFKNTSWSSANDIEINSKQ